MDVIIEVEWESEYSDFPLVFSFVSIFLSHVEALSPGDFDFSVNFV